MGRSKWKCLFLNKQVWRILFKLKKINKAKKKVKNFEYIRLLQQTVFYNKSFKIIKIFIKRYIFLYKAGSKVVIWPRTLHVGYNFGEFMYTRKFYYFPQKERKKKR